mmetsp:Transcript_36484/g.145857  ORF Transcript_36484/g.145857 Transcript_36484/m.145857 type:complete len:82 (+) Transcript_36484:1051-1296(+)
MPACTELGRRAAGISMAMLVNQDESEEDGSLCSGSFVFQGRCVGLFVCKENTVHCAVAGGYMMRVCGALVGQGGFSKLGRW